MLKVYEISSVDKDGNESSKKPIDVSKKSSHVPLCACRIRGCVTDFTNLTPEYLYTLTKEQIIDVLQKVRTEVLKAQDRSEKHVSHRP